MYAKLQQPDGYLSSWYQRIQPGKRWTNLRDCHELYCAGHLIEGAVAYYQATGKRKLLDVMCRYADHIASVLRPGAGQEARAIAAMRRSSWRWSSSPRVTGERKYLELAKYFIDQRGQQPHYFDEEARARGADPKDFHFKTYEYNQSHKPVREQDKVVGHAVRAMYLYSGMADIATEYGDDSLTTALDRLWDDLVSKRLYVTGGLGPSADNEGFTADYDLPNETAYAETCAAVGAGVLGEPHARHGPERALCRRDGAGALQRLDLGPVARRLAVLLREPAGEPGRPQPLEMASLPVLPAQYRPHGRLDRQLFLWPGGRRTRRPPLRRQHRPLRHRRDAGAPDPAKPTIHGMARSRSASSPSGRREFTLHLRIPAWCRKATFSVNGAAGRSGRASPATAMPQSGANGARATGWLDLDMPIARLYANPEVRQDIGRVALSRGPLIYCVEETDNASQLHRIALARTARSRRMTSRIFWAAW